MEQDQAKELIVWACNDIRDMLLAKNSDYGNSALEPVRIFSKADTIEQIKIRIDDKLSRIQNISNRHYREDTLQDLIGYLILLVIAERRKGLKNDSGG
jgi:hypothetical protein